MAYDIFENTSFDLNTMGTLIQTKLHIFMILSTMRITMV